jgi:Na+-translocating ferredoxin:NAD+ oxidoreductase RNF subunit RnfB
MVLLSMAIIGGVGVVFATFIAAAYMKLRVWEDPRIDAVAGMLPNANCGACGLPGCRAFAEQAVEGKVKPAQCSVMGEDGVTAIADYLGIDAGQAVKRVARLLCAGGLDVTTRPVEYRGLRTCAAATAVAAGGKGCAWGCLGLGDCATACEFGAITMDDAGLPVVDSALCMACGDCVTACPKDLFVIRPLDQHLLVQCRNLLTGDAVLDQCRVACTACGKCVQDAASGLISVASGVAVINESLLSLENAAAVSRCPTNAIVWLQGAQFVRHADADTSRRAVA